MMQGVVELLSKRNSLMFFTALFVGTQSWIGAVLGHETSKKVLYLQTFCVVGAQDPPQWSDDDVKNFQRHFLIDSWFHPVVYALALTCAVLYDARCREADTSTGSRWSWMFVALAVLGACCDVVENQLHQSVSFAPPRIIASHELLFWACGFASAKWALLGAVVLWVFWRFTFGVSAKQKLVDDSCDFAAPAGWDRPSPSDIRNAGYQQAGWIEIQGRQIPWTLSPANYGSLDRSYVVSAYAHYIGYAFDEVKVHLTSSWSRLIANLIVSCVALVAQLLKLDEAIFVNNHLISTCLWPNGIMWSSSRVEDINAKLQKIAPDKALVWRSIDKLSQPSLTQLLSDDSSCLLIPARIVCWLDDVKSAIESPKSNQLKIDLKLFRQKVGWDIKEQAAIQAMLADKPPTLEMTTIPPEDLTLAMCEAMIDLYDELYLVKYSRRNPQLTPPGLHRLAQSGFFAPLEILRLRSNPSRIVAFATGIILDGVVTYPFGGYDMHCEDSRILYRLLTMLVLNQSFRDSIPQFHMSGGVSKFKQNRGARPTVEYIGVFADHLSFRQRLGWKILKVITDRIITVERSQKKAEKKAK